MAKTVNLGPLALGIGIVSGVAQVTADVDLTGSLGGGSAAGVVTGKVGLHAEGDVSSQQLADLAVTALEAAFPAATALLEMVRSGVDAEIQKLTV
jgi:hypothetical protein